MSSEEWTSPVIDVSSIEVEAKEAYAQHRLRDCIRLVNSLLLEDPDNDTGLTLQASVSEDLDSILNEARALIEERQIGTMQGRLCGAEVLLRKVLDIEPTHKGANTLLQATKALAKKFEPTVEKNAKTADMPFTVAAGPVRKAQEKPSLLSYKSALVVVSVLVAGGLLFAKDFHLRSAPPAQAPVTPQASRGSNINVGRVPGSASPLPVIPQATVQKVAETTPPPVVETRPARASVVVTAKPELVATMQFGSLAISSPVATDVFSGDQLLGSTPITLQLPAGNQTLEYRHANLRKSVTHQVRADETTTALITFDVVVQVNAKPWANVFIDGSERQSLGQTPLSDVHVPIGRVLVFENPKFPSKSYRVTGKESSVQIVFP